MPLSDENISKHHDGEVSNSSASASFETILNNYFRHYFHTTIWFSVVFLVLIALSVYSYDFIGLTIFGGIGVGVVLFLNIYNVVQIKRAIGMVATVQPEARQVTLYYQWTGTSRKSKIWYADSHDTHGNVINTFQFELCPDTKKVLEEMLRNRQKSMALLDAPYEDPLVREDVGVMQVFMTTNPLYPVILHDAYSVLVGQVLSPDKSSN